MPIRGLLLVHPDFTGGAPVGLEEEDALAMAPTVPCRRNAHARWSSLTLAHGGSLEKVVEDEKNTGQDYTSSPRVAPRSGRQWS